MATVSVPADLVAAAESQKAMIVLADVEGLSHAVVSAIQTLRGNAATSHIPVIAFARELDDPAQGSLVAKGATIAVTESAVLGHLSQLLNRALEVH